jgi:VanZ family protein
MTSKRNKVWLIPAFAWWAITFWLLTLPGSKIPHEDWYDIVQVDKWVHFAFFFTWVVLFVLALRTRTWLISITVAAILYGIAIEFIQKYCIVNRSFDLWDVMADGVGAIAAYFTAKKKILSSI